MPGEMLSVIQMIIAEFPTCQRFPAMNEFGKLCVYMMIKAFGYQMVTVF